METQQIPIGPQGGADGTDGDHPSFRTRALHPQLNKVQGTCQSSTFFLSSRVSSLGRSHFRPLDLKREGGGSPLHLNLHLHLHLHLHRRLMMSCQLLLKVQVQVKNRNKSMMEKGEVCLASALAGRKPGHAWIRQGRNWDEHAPFKLKSQLD